jgi:hypothetical protein
MCIDNIQDFAFFIVYIDPHVLLFSIIYSQAFLVVARKDVAYHLLNDANVATVETLEREQCGGLNRKLDGLALAAGPQI